MEWNSLDEALSSGVLKDYTFRSLYFGQKALADSCGLLKSIRRDRRMTQEELARRVGSTQQSISRWERGDVSNVSLAFLARVAAALEVQPQLAFIEYQQGRTPTTPIRQSESPESEHFR